MYKTNKYGNISFTAYGDGGIVVYIASGEHEDNSSLYDELNKASNGNIELVVLSADNWNRDYSPWISTPVRGDNMFEGGGEETLKTLINDIIPEAEYGKTEKRYLAGYSLGGLFSLWAFYSSDMFDGCASCSGSLWFPEWRQKMSCVNDKVKENSIVYLSLGTKEEKTRNPVMSRVGDETRAEFEILKANPNIADCVLEWNNGGHFNEPDKRLKNGIMWLIKHK